MSDESERAEVYIQPFPGPGPKIPVSSDGGLQPVWGKIGRELFRAADALMEVPVRLNPLQVGAARELLDLPRALYGVDQFTPDYDVAADGRLLAIRRDASAADEITVVLNWTEELRRALGR